MGKGHRLKKSAQKWHMTREEKRELRRVLGVLFRPDDSEEKRELMELLGLRHPNKQIFKELIGLHPDSDAKRELLEFIERLPDSNNESLGARSEIALTPALGDLLANFIDPKRTNPGLNLIEQKWRRDFWFRCTILVAREIQGPPRRSYEDATKIVA